MIMSTKFIDLKSLHYINRLTSIINQILIQNRENNFSHLFQKNYQAKPKKNTKNKMQTLKVYMQTFKSLHTIIILDINLSFF